MNSQSPFFRFNGKRVPVRYLRLATRSGECSERSPRQGAPFLFSSCILKWFPPPPPHHHHPPLLPSLGIKGAARWNRFSSNRVPPSFSFARTPFRQSPKEWLDLSSSL